MWRVSAATIIDMANCSLCGQPAGFLKSKHKACEAKHAEAWDRMIAFAAEAVRKKTSHMDLEAGLQEIATASFVEASRVREAIVRGWEQSVEHFLEDGHLEEAEEAHLADFASRLSLAQADLDSRGAYSRLVKGGVLRDLLNGVVPKRIQIQGQLPFNFQKNEQLIFVFQGVKYYEDRKRRSYVGTSHGVSVRIAKGLYYRTSAFRGHPVETTETVFAGEGLLAVTTKHLYFAGAKSVRLPHSKIVVIQPYQDGVGIQRDAQTAGRQLFVTGDGWFTYNLLTNVSNL
jgi:hypothetical protein